MPSVMSILVDRHCVHMLLAVGCMGVPQMQHLLRGSREGRVHEGGLAGRRGRRDGGDRYVFHLGLENDVVALRCHPLLKLILRTS